MQSSKIHMSSQSRNKYCKGISASASPGGRGRTEISVSSAIAKMALRRVSVVGTIRKRFQTNLRAHQDKLTRNKRSLERKKSNLECFPHTNAENMPTKPPDRRNVKSSLPIMKQLQDEKHYKHNIQRIMADITQDFSNRLLHKDDSRYENLCAQISAKRDQRDKREKEQAQGKENAPFRVPPSKLAQQTVTLFLGNRRNSIASNLLLQQLHRKGPAKLPDDSRQISANNKLREAIQKMQRTMKSRDSIGKSKTTSGDIRRVKGGGKEYSRRGSVCLPRVLGNGTANASPETNEKLHPSLRPLHLLETVQNIGPFSPFKMDELLQIVRVMECVQLPLGGALRDEAEKIDQLASAGAGWFCYLQSGVCATFCPRTGECTKQYQAGSYWGEDYLMFDECNGCPNVVAQTPSTVWTLSSANFRSAIAKQNEEAFRVFKHYIDFIPKLANRLQTYESVHNLFCLFDTETYSPGSVLQADGADNGGTRKLYVVKHGTVRWVRKLSENYHGGNSMAIPLEKEGTLRAGGIFGMFYLQPDTEENRTKCTVPTTLFVDDGEGVECFTAPVDVLKHFFDSSYDPLKRQGCPREPRSPAYSVPWQYQPPRRTSSSIAVASLGALDVDLCTVKARLRQGRWSSELAVVEQVGKDSGRKASSFHVRCILKKRMEAAENYDQLLEERRNVLRVRHPFVIRLRRIGEDPEALYMAFEPVKGGTLSRLLERQSLGYFHHETARFYVASIILVLEHLALLNIAHRDLTTRNVGLDKHGYVKIMGFQDSKTVEHRTFTLCGTPAFMSPEMILFRGYGMSTDAWSLGVLAHELLFGINPYACSSDFKTCSKIVSGGAPQMVNCHSSVASRDFVYRLLKPRPSFRLGCGVHGPRGMRKHSWFEGLVWEKLKRKRTKAPVLLRSSHKGKSNYETKFDGDCFKNGKRLSQFVRSELCGVCPPRGGVPTLPLLRSVPCDKASQTFHAWMSAVKLQGGASEKQPQTATAK